MKKPRALERPWLVTLKGFRLPGDRHTPRRNDENTTLCEAGSDRLYDADVIHLTTVFLS